MSDLTVNGGNRVEEGTGRLGAYVALLTAVFIWGVNFHAVHVAAKEFQSFTYLASRFWIAALIYAGVQLFISGTRNAWIVSGPNLLMALGVAASLVGFYGLQTESIIKSDAVNAAFLTATVALWVPLLSRIVFRNPGPVSKDLTLGIFIALAGFAVKEGVDPRHLSWGDLAGLLSALVLAFELILVGKVAKTMSAKQLFTWTMNYTILVAILFSILAAAFDSSRGAPSPRTWQGTAGLLFSAVFATALANFLANWANSRKLPTGVQTIGADHRALMENLDAPIALLSGVLLLGSGFDLSVRQLSGCSLIFGGVLVAELALWTRWRP